MFQSNNLSQPQSRSKVEQESGALSIPVSVWEQLMNERRMMADELSRARLTTENASLADNSNTIELEPAEENNVNELPVTDAEEDQPELQDTSNLTSLSPQGALLALQSNPVQFVQAVIDEEAGKHLVRLKEEAELQGALRAFRKKYPELQAFEGLILEQVATVINEDEDGILEPWDVLFEKGRERFELNFQGMLINSTTQSREDVEPRLNDIEPPHLEGASAREPKEGLPSFSRQQIANMSLAEFKKNESKINQALKMKRIR